MCVCRVCVCVRVGVGCVCCWVESGCMLLMPCTLCFAAEGAKKMYIYIYIYTPTHTYFLNDFIFADR